MTFTSQMYLFPYRPHEHVLSTVWVGWWSVDTRALHAVVRAAARAGIVTSWDDASTRGLWYEAHTGRVETWLRARCTQLAGAPPVQVIENREPTKR